MPGTAGGGQRVNGVVVSHRLTSTPDVVTLVKVTKVGGCSLGQGMAVGASHKSRSQQSWGPLLPRACSKLTETSTT